MIRAVAAPLGDLVAAGLVVGAVEAVRITGSGSPLWTAAIAVGLVLILATAVGVPIVLAAALVGAQPWARAFARDLGAAGPARVRAIWRALLLALGLAAVFAAVYALSVKTHHRFNAAGALGLLHATVAVATVALVTLALLGLDAALGDRVARLEWLSFLLSGKTGVATGVVALAGAASLISGVAHAAAPAADFRPLALAGLFVAALAAARLYGVSRRLPDKAVAALLAGAVLLSTLALVELSARDVARARVAGRGIPSRVVLRLLWRLTDADGDGFASRFGGGDCDDSNPKVSPMSDEIVGNGVDDNCAGGDAALADMPERTRKIPSHTPAAPRRNVFLITIDALRADHVGAYGYGRPTTPNIDRLAARGSRFDWAISPSPTTRRAIPALMSGRYASTLAFVEGGKQKIWPPHLKRGYHWMLGQGFEAAGYQTQAILCCTTLFDRRMGVVEGIQHVDAEAARLRRKYHGDVLAKKVAQWMATGRDPARPFFLWVHFIDAHNPYQRLPGAPDFGARPIDRYDGEIWYVDDKIGAMLKAVEDAGLKDDTVVVVTADHGDEFLEHGHLYHGRSVYNELLRIPLVIAAPGRKPAVVPGPVSLIDVGPTVLDLVGLPRPAGLNGRSLAAAVGGGGAIPDRMVLSELIADRNITRNLRAGLDGDWKIIWDLDANTYELYSLADDPGDRDDVRGSEAETFARMKAELQKTIDLELSLLPTDKNFRERALRGKSAAEGRRWKH